MQFLGERMQLGGNEVFETKRSSSRRSRRSAALDAAKASKKEIKLEVQKLREEAAFQRSTELQQAKRRERQRKLQEEVEALQKELHRKLSKAKQVSQVTKVPEVKQAKAPKDIKVPQVEESKSSRSATRSANKAKVRELKMEALIARKDQLLQKKQEKKEQRAKKRAEMRKRKKEKKRVHEEDGGLEEIKAARRAFRRLARQKERWQRKTLKEMQEQAERDQFLKDLDQKRMARSEEPEQIECEPGKLLEEKVPPDAKKLTRCDRHKLRGQLRWAIGGAPKLFFCRSNISVFLSLML
jgi:hypothetical protein